MSEFDLIQTFFARPSEHTLLGVGDDAALIQPRPGKVLAISSDMLVAGRHFFADTNPYRLGRKTLAVNLSDMAAMGAEPRWAVLSIAIPKPDASWLKPFSQGFYDEARAHHVDWVGGDTTAGPLNLSVTIIGEVDQRQALQRSGAQVGDDIWVSGTLGDAAMGLACINQYICLPKEHKDFCIQRLEQPTARVNLGLRLAGLAHSAIDLSDGLMADLGHILTASEVGADIEFASVPLSVALKKCAYPAQVREVTLGGGDDYELCFTASPDSENAIREAGRWADTQVTQIGKIVTTRGLRVLDAMGNLITPKRRGFDHFSEQSAQQ